MNAYVSDRAFCVISGVFALLLMADAYTVRQIRGMNLEATQFEQAVAADLAGLRQFTASINESHHSGIEQLASELTTTKIATTAAAESASAEAERYAQSLAKRIARRRQTELSWVSRELTGIKAVAYANEQSVERLRRELSAVRAQTAAAKRRTLAARSGATSLAVSVPPSAATALHQESAITLIRTTAESKTFEFYIKAAGQAVRLPGLSLILEDADRRRNRFSIAVLAGDKRLEASDRTLNEPIRLYLGNSDKPVELRATEVGTGEIRGLLVVPAHAEIARGYSSGSADTENLPVR